MPQVSREDHFVPAFYLVNFTDTHKRNGQLWQFDGVGGTIESGRAKDLGKELDYHSVEIEGLPVDVVEALFSKIEGKAAPVIRTIIAARKLPATSREIADLMMFVALSYGRGPQHRNFLKTFNNESETLKIRMALMSPVLWSHYVRACEKQGLPYPKGTYSELNELYRRDEAVFEMANSGQIHTIGLVQSLHWLFDMLLKRQWGLEVASGPGDFFVTSDTPASVTWTDSEDFHMGACGLVFQRSEVAFPLTKRMALVGHYGPVPDSTDVDGNRVAAINFATVQFAHQFVYGPATDFVFMPPDGVWRTADDWFATRRRNN